MTRKTYGREPGLIQDITSSTTDVNARNSKVHTSTSIGELNDVWQRQADTAFHGLGVLPYSAQGASGQTAQKSRSLYNPALRVAPLSLHATDFSDGLLERAGRWLSRLTIVMWLAISAFVERSWVKTTRLAHTRLPKNYSLVSGAHTDWRTTIIGGIKRVAIPMGAVAALLILAFALPGDQPASPSTKKGHNPTVTANTVSDGKTNTSGTQTGSKPGATTPTNQGAINASPGSRSLSLTSQGSTSSIPVTYTPQTTYSGGTIGGYGGGTSNVNTPPGTDPSTSALGSIPGVTTPYPVTTPGQTVDLNGKPVASTSPTTITLN